MAGRNIVYKVDIKGVKIKNLSGWKKLNPRKVWFDSELERKCYMLLKEAKFNFSFHPETRQLVGNFNTWALSKGKDARKLFKSTVRPISYTSDFAIYCNDGTTVFVEAKGFFHPDARLRYKLFQQSLAHDELSLLAFDKTKDMKDMKAIIRIVKETFGGSSSSPEVKKKSPKITKI